MAVPARPLPITPPERGGEPGRHLRRRRKPRGRVWQFIREFLIVIVLALALSALVRAVFLQAFYVPSASMEETLLPSDRIVASKLTTRFAGIERGEVVVFKDPGSWLPEPSPPTDDLRGYAQRAFTFLGLLPSDSGKDLVKRIVAVGGDRIACCDAMGRIVLNGSPLDEDYIIGPTDQVRFDVIVPDDGLFVMGDNRPDSRDSRYYIDDGASGSVPTDNVVGRVVAVVWPVNRMSTVPIRP
jgi:signal peptidase I